MTTLLIGAGIIAFVLLWRYMCKKFIDKEPPIEEYEEYFLNDDHYITIWRKNKNHGTI